MLGCSILGRPQPHSIRPPVPSPVAERAFLRAQWRDLVMLNYEVPPALLEPLVPAGVELDRWQGRLYASVVGFLFRDTRVLGLTVPGHTTFEEVNLRFYVRRHVGGEVRRGVVFVRELVPCIRGGTSGMRSPRASRATWRVCTVMRSRQCLRGRRCRRSSRMARRLPSIARSGYKAQREGREEQQLPQRPRSTPVMKTALCRLCTLRGYSGRSS